MRRLALALVPLLLLTAWPTSATAGGAAEDYRRAKRLAAAVRGKLQGAQLGEVWLDDTTLVYRRAKGDKGWRWTRVDADTGKRAEAFDHDQVAAQLSELLRDGNNATFLGDRLPFRPLKLDGTEIVGLVRSDAVAVEPATSKVRRIDIEEIESLTLRRRREDRSRGGGADTSILFLNRSKEAVRLVWLSHAGKPRVYHTLEAGKRHRQHTFPGHAWRVETTKGTSWGVYVAQDTPGVVLVSAPEPAPKKPRVRRRSADSPDGRYRAFLRDHQVLLRDRKTKKEHALSTTGSAEDRFTTRWMWSPTSRYLMVVQEKPAQTRTVHVVNSVPAERFQPTLISQNYLKPGDRIAVPRPRLFDVKAKAQVEIPDDLYATPWHITRLSWSKDGATFRFLYNQRGHQVLRLVELDPKRGTARAIIDETSKTFIDYSQKTFLYELEKQGAWIWMSERSGYNHLYLVDGRRGKTTPITKGDWVVHHVRGVHESRGHVRFEAMGARPEQDPYHIHVGRIDLDGANLVWETEGDGTHALRHSPGGDYYVDTWSRVDQPPVHELRRAKDGSLVVELARADASRLDAIGRQPTLRFHAKGRDGKTDIWGVIHRPSNFDPKRTYPVIESIYAGPHGHFVPKRFRAWSGAKSLAEIGFVVVQIDGMGTNWRSKAFHDVCWKNLGDSGFPDRIAWMKAAAKKHPWMDLTRVGIFGGSAGGQSALRALLAHGDFYKAAVADCGCHDNRMDKIWWNEAWMGWPVGPHYAAQSNITQAHKLEGKLFLIVGEIDQNVDPASTMKVVDALIKADKDFDLLVVPGRGHGAGGLPYARRRTTDFFVRHLLGKEPRTP